MSGDTLGLAAAVSIALGGMIGGGIYAVLGVLASLTGPATWAAFVGAGAVVLVAELAYFERDWLDEVVPAGPELTSRG